MGLQRGEVVLIPFPYTDLSVTKTRPAVVISSALYHQTRPECLLAYVSSQVMQADPHLDYVLLDWGAAGLLKPSFVRPKIAAIDPALVVYQVGVLSARDQLALDRCLRRAMALTATALEDVLAEVDFATLPPVQVQALAEKSMTTALALQQAGVPGIDLARLRQGLCDSVQK